MSRVNRGLKILLPIGMLVLGFVGFNFMAGLRGEPETRSPEKFIPIVRAATVTRESFRFEVTSQGNASPKTVLNLAPEVTGRIVFLSPNLKAGAFFEKGELLLELDAFDYHQALISARGEQARARVALTREEAAAKVAREEWNDLGNGDNNPLATRQLQVEEARAVLEASNARLAQAERNLERCKINAPFDGRVMEENIDEGQFVSVGQPIARFYALDAVEITLPIPTSDTRLLDLPMGRDIHAGPQAEFWSNAGSQHSWNGRIVRTEGMIDPRTRMVQAVAEVKQPFAQSVFPLTPGLFVHARIQGRQVDNVTILPRTALWPEDRVVIIDSENRLYYRDVEIIHKTDLQVIIGNGLARGERVCLTHLDAMIEGMSVRVAEESEERS